MKKTILKVMSVSIILAVCLSMTACGKKVEQTTATTADNTIVDESEVAISESAESESSETETEVTTESSNSAMTDGQYTYVVDGIEVHLRTNIDDYIQPDQWGGYGVDLEGIANAWGFEYTFSQDDPVAMRNSWTLRTDSVSTAISLEEISEQNYYRLSLSIGNNSRFVDFSRNDVSDDSITTYWISYADDAINKVNYEEIVIFTLLIENSVISPSENWMEDLGFTGISSNRLSIDR